MEKSKQDDLLYIFNVIDDQGPSLECMNEVFGQLGEYNTIKQENGTRVPCLAACEDQINQISISMSTLPNA